MLIILEVFSIYLIIEHFVFLMQHVHWIFFIFSMWFSSFVFVFFLVMFVIALSTAETMLRRRLDQIVFDFNQQSLQIN